MRILALVPGGIDDQILFFPTLDTLRRNYPKAEIDVIAEPRSIAVYRLCRSVDTALAFDFLDRNGLADLGNLLGIIRDHEYDLVVSLDRRWVIDFLLWLSGIPTRVGYAGTAGEIFLTNSVSFKGEQYRAEAYHDLLQGLGITTSCPEINISLLKKDLQWAEAEQQKLGIQETGYILIHGGSKALAQWTGVETAYPAEKWQQIIKAIQERQPNLPVVVLQGFNDRSFGTQLQQSNSGLKVSTPPDIGKLAAMIAGANLMLCTDTPELQLAVGLQTYTIALFGPTDPKKSLPTSDKFMAIKSPTNKMVDIYPQMVLEKVWGS